MCRGGTGASARTTTTYFQLLPTSCYYYYLLPTTYDNIHMRGGSPPLLFRERATSSLAPFNFQAPRWGES